MSTPITWAIRVDWTRLAYNEPEIEQLLTELSDLRPSLSVDDDERPGYSPHYAVNLTVEEASLRQAIATALRRVEDATGVKASGVEAIPRHQVARRLERPAFPELVGTHEIAEILGVTRQRAAKIAEQPGFPGPVITTKNGSLRVRAAVEAWAENTPRRPGRPPKNPRHDEPETARR